MNIELIREPLRKLNQIRGVYYSRVDNVNDVVETVSPVQSQQQQRFVGVIAQDVLQVLPELVRPSSQGRVNRSNWEGNNSLDASNDSEPTGNAKFMSVKYQGFIPLMIEAIKELESLLSDIDDMGCSRDGKREYGGGYLDGEVDDGNSISCDDVCACDEIELEQSIIGLERRVVEMQGNMMATLSAVRTEWHKLIGNVALARISVANRSFSGRVSQFKCSSTCTQDKAVHGRSTPWCPYGQSIECLF